MMSFGILRSLVIYHLRPGRRARLRHHYAPFVPSGGLAFDVGAHVGSRTRAFASLGASVVAVEPQADLAALLRRFFRKSASVRIEHCALGAEEGEIDLYGTTRNLTVATTSADWAARAPGLPGWEGVEFSPTARVPQITLDSLIDRYGQPDFIKIDVEGSEDAVLAGLSRPVPALSYEFLPADRDVAYHATVRLEHLAREHGGSWEYNFSLGEELRLVMPDRWWDATELQAYLAEIPEDGPSGDIYARYSA